MTRAEAYAAEMSRRGALDFTILREIALGMMLLVAMGAPLHVAYALQQIRVVYLWGYDEGA